MKFGFVLIGLAYFLDFSAAFRYPSPILFNYNRPPRYVTPKVPKPEIIEIIEPKLMVPTEDLKGFKRNIFVSLRKLGRVSLNYGK